MKTKVTTKRPTTLRGRVKRHARLAVVPHRENQFRPHLIRWYGIMVLLVVVSITLGGSLWQKGQILGVEASITSTDLLNDTNNERQKGGEQPLHYSEQLAAAAFLKAQDMFRQQYWAHTAPDGTTPWHWFAQAGYNYASAGENLAKNFTSTDTVIAAWMASQKHRENILNTDFKDVGFAVMDGMLDGRQTTIIVALYGQPTSAVAGASVPAPLTFAPDDGLSPISRFGVALQSMAPMTLGSILLLLVGTVVALFTHAYRRQLPRPIRESWRYHHGAYKAIGLTAIIVAVITLYSGGQI